MQQFIIYTCTLDLPGYKTNHQTQQQQQQNQDVEPLGGLNLQGYSATLVNEFSEPLFVIRLSKYGGQPNYFGSDDKCQIQNWIDAINKAATEANQVRLIFYFQA